MENTKIFQPTWYSLSQFEVPRWYKDGKFGIFIHWGLYSVPAFDNEWYSRNMYIPEEKAFSYHIQKFGPHKDFGYKDFIEMFHAEKFNPMEWAELFRNAGAKYVIPVAEHHDGFQMYGSKLSPFNSENMGPKRDILGELKDAVEEKGLVFGCSSHRAEHNFFFWNGTQFDSDVNENKKPGKLYWPAEKEPEHFDFFSTPYPSKEFLDDWLARCRELVDRFKPQLFYFDWWIQHDSFKDHLKEFAAYYYNQCEENNRPGVICYKHDAMAFGTGIVDVERGQFKEVQPFYWQTDTSLYRNSWCYTENLEYKTSAEIISTLIEVVCKNGNLLLNIGPKANGEIHEKDQQILLEIGEWLRINGEAIYGSCPWKVNCEGDTQVASGHFNEHTLRYQATDIRFTTAKGNIYAIAMNINGVEDLCIKSFSRSQNHSLKEFNGFIKEVVMLGGEQLISWRQDNQGLNIKIPRQSSGFPVVFKIVVG